MRSTADKSTSPSFSRQAGLYSSGTRYVKKEVLWGDKYWMEIKKHLDVICDSRRGAEESCDKVHALIANSKNPAGYLNMALVYLENVKGEHAAIRKFYTDISIDCTRPEKVEEYCLMHIKMQNEKDALYERELRAVQPQGIRDDDAGWVMLKHQISIIENDPYMDDSERAANSIRKFILSLDNTNPFGYLLKLDGYINNSGLSKVHRFFNPKFGLDHPEQIINTRMEHKAKMLREAEEAAVQAQLEAENLRRRYG